MSKLFQVIVVDPPYGFSDTLSMSDVKRGASSNYSTMSMEDIKNLKVEEISDPDGCLLALWVPSSLLQEGLDIMKSWKFAQKQTFIWIKTKKNPLKDIITALKPSQKLTINNFESYIKQIFDLLTVANMNSILSFGMGSLFRQTHEVCLIGINNTKIYKTLKNKSQRSVSFAPNLKHSAKPEHLQDYLEKMFPDAKKLEIFGRRSRNGWLVLGNQSPDTMGEDIRASLEKLLE